jgi:hypothetical protein
LLSTSVGIFLLHTVAMAEIDPHQLYLILSTSKTTTLQKEIDEATVEGFRILATTGRGGGQVVLMRRSAPKEEDFRYRVLGTTKIDTMEKELNEAAAAGYCFLPGTMLARNRAFGIPELVAFLERPPESSRECEYRVLGTSRTGKMQEELVVLEEEGFKLVDITQASELAAVLERQR